MEQIKREKSNVMKCKRCGEEIANDSKFCEFCGTKSEKKQIKWWQLILGLIGLTGGLLMIKSSGTGWIVIVLIIIVFLVMKLLAYMKEKNTTKK